MTPFYDIQNDNLTLEQSHDIITLGQQLINKNWEKYKTSTLNDKYEQSFVTRYISSIFLSKKRTVNVKTFYRIILF